jgi:hypothetical protein
MAARRRSSHSKFLKFNAGVDSIGGRVRTKFLRIWRFGVRRSGVSSSEGMSRSAGTP